MPESIHWHDDQHHGQISLHGNELSAEYKGRTVYDHKVPEPIVTMLELLIEEANKEKSK